nr:Gfo/Idh/MocA family oxidoreductase [Candidatus Sigynarchaeota archaeon]
MDKKKIVIVGLGGMGRGWLGEIKKHPDYQLIGIVDTDTELLENIAKPTGLSEDKGYISIEDAVRYGEKPDVAVISTPINTHHSIVREALGLGINVICEKNMAETIQQGRQMLQASLDHPELCTAVGTQNRFTPGFWSAKQFFKSPECEEKFGKLGVIKWYDNGYRGETRWGWRRHLMEIYAMDQAPHWYDSLRCITGMDIVQVKADCFMPRYSQWHGSSTIMANLALAAPDDYKHRHNWVWCQLFGDWQLGGPSSSSFQFFGEKGQFAIEDQALHLKLYKDPTNRTISIEEDAYLPIDAGPIRGTPYERQGVILEQMSKGIDSAGKTQPDTCFKEAFKSFAVSMAAIESSHTGQAIWVPKYWEDFPCYQG